SISLGAEPRVVSGGDHTSHRFGWLRKHLPELDSDVSMSYCSVWVAEHLFVRNGLKAITTLPTELPISVLQVRRETPSFSPVVQWSRRRFCAHTTRTVVETFRHPRMTPARGIPQYVSCFLSNHGFASSCLPSSEKLNTGRKLSR
ncbi:unnamed protein product, partial [Ectocarpus sp. 12 AP-2014]